MSFLHRTPLWLVLIGLMAVLVVPAPGQDPNIPPFDRQNPPGDPPPVPGFGDQPGAMDQQPAQGNANQPEVLGKGPVHEAFAQPHAPNALANPVVNKRPPELINEIPPDQKPEGDNVIWIPGYWTWDEDRNDYVWISGIWRIPPPGRKWVPGYWSEVDGGFRWVSGLWAGADQPAMPIAPAPPENLDQGPNQPAPGEGFNWVPGVWQDMDNRWQWQPGYWIAPRPGWVFCPPRWCWTPRGCLFVGGYWDRGLGSRGVAFAPVYFGGGGGWFGGAGFYRPWYALNMNLCLDAFWARPNCGYYAFGDYYGAGYLRRGFQPWCQFGPRYRDPLFAYYQQVNGRNNPVWAQNLARTYQGRRDGNLPLPPRVYTGAGARNLAGPQLAQPLNNYRNPELNLARLPNQQRTQLEQLASNYRQAGLDRARVDRVPVPRGTRPELSLSRVPVTASAQRIPSPNGITRIPGGPTSPAPSAIPGSPTNPRPGTNPGTTTRGYFSPAQQGQVLPNETRNLTRPGTPEKMLPRREAPPSPVTPVTPVTPGTNPPINPTRPRSTPPGITLPNPSPVTPGSNPVANPATPNPVRPRSVSPATPTPTPLPPTGRPGVSRESGMTIEGLPLGPRTITTPNITAPTITPQGSGLPRIIGQNSGTAPLTTARPSIGGIPPGLTTPSSPTFGIPRSYSAPNIGLPGMTGSSPRFNSGPVTMPGLSRPGPSMSPGPTSSPRFAPSQPRFRSGSPDTGRPGGLFK